MFVAMLVYIPMAFLNPFVAYLLWGWSATVSLNYYLYGFMESVRYNLIFAAITLGLLFIGKLKNRGALELNRTTALLIIFLAHGCFSAIFSYEQNQFNIEYFIFFAKGLIFVLVMPYFLNSRYRIHAFLVVITLGLGFHGVVEGLKVLVTAGKHTVSGLHSTMLSDNNHFAVGMVIILPIMYYLYIYSIKRVAKFGFLCGIFLTVLAILGTKSRGGFLSLLVVGFWLLLTSRRKVLAGGIVLASTVLILLLAPDSWFSRVETLSNASDDVSFMGRVVAWKVSSAIALENPIFGGGFHAVQEQWIWDKFWGNDGLLPFVSTDQTPIVAKAAHSIYFEVLGDRGFIGLGIFIAILFNVFYTRIEIKGIVKNGGSDFLWARDLADLLAVSVAAYAVGGAGVSLAYLESIYVIVMLQEIVKQLILNETERVPEIRTVR